MRKPESLDGRTYMSGYHDDKIVLGGLSYYNIKEIPKLIKWLEKVQKYNEFKKKVKKK